MKERVQRMVIILVIEIIWKLKTNLAWYNFYRENSMKFLYYFQIDFIPLGNHDLM